jgi:hypothetical protein
MVVLLEISRLAEVAMVMPAAPPYPTLFCTGSGYDLT